MDIWFWEGRQMYTLKTLVWGIIAIVENTEQLKISACVTLNGQIA